MSTPSSHPTGRALVASAQHVTLACVAALALCATAVPAAGALLVTAVQVWRRVVVGRSHRVAAVPSDVVARMREAYAQMGVRVGKRLVLAILPGLLAQVLLPFELGLLAAQLLVAWALARSAVDAWSTATALSAALQRVEPS